MLFRSAFVSRGVEYLLIKQETVRLEGYYHSTGTLTASSGVLYKDARGAAAYLESNPLVESVNIYNYVSGVIQEDIQSANTGSHYGEASKYFAFYGTLTKWDQKQFHFLADEVIEGFPEVIKSGREIVLNRTSGTLADRYQRYYDIMRDYYVDTLLTGDPQDPDAAYDHLEQGQRYLVVGYYDENEAPGMCNVMYHSGDDTYTTYAIYSHPLTDSFFYPVPEGEADWSDSRLSVIRRHLDLIHEEQRALNVIPIQDMEVLPITKNQEAGLYLTEGRWITGEDSAQKNPVCVITSAFASCRDLKLGDRLTIRLRDIPSYFGLFHDGTPTRMGDPWALDLETLATTEDNYEIVGIYDYLDTYDYAGRKNTDVQNFVYVPAFVLPESFRLDYGNQDFAENVIGEYVQMSTLITGTSCPLPYPGSVSFQLVRAENENQFLVEAGPALAELGFVPIMEENGWESFQSAAQPMRESSLYNLIIYATVLLATLGLITFVYFFSRRKEMQIARTQGLPAAVAGRQIAVPLLLIGLASILPSSGAGWWYAGRSADRLLAALPAVAEAEAGAAIPVQWGVVLCAVPGILLIVLAVSGSVYLTRRPLMVRQMGAKR